MLRSRRPLFDQKQDKAGGQESDPEQNDKRNGESISGETSRPVGVALQVPFKRVVFCGDAVRSIWHVGLQYGVHGVGQGDSGAVEGVAIEVGGCVVKVVVMETHDVALTERRHAHLHVKQGHIYRHLQEE